MMRYKIKKNRTKKSKFKKNNFTRNKFSRNKSSRNKSSRNKTIRTKINITKDRIMKGGNNISNFTINQENYVVSVYNEGNANYDTIKDEAKFMCEDMYHGYDPEDTSELVREMLDTTDEIYILRDNFDEINAFITIKYNYCNDCMHCPLNCAYILLTCVKKEKRGKKLFASFLRAVEMYLKSNGVTCVRLTAVNNDVYNIYKKLGFNTENKQNYECEYKMIKNI